MSNIETTIVKLSEAEVTIKKHYTWGDKEKIQAVLLKGAKLQGSSKDFDFDTDAMLESKYKAIECAVISIKEGENSVEWTKEWQNNLSVEDGDNLMESVDNLSKKK